MTSLIISDDVLMRNALADVLATAGASSVAVDGIEDAIARLETSTFALIFAPQHIPGLSGSEICARLRATAGGENAWIVALPRLEVVAVRQVITSGFDSLLKAPFDPAEIALLVAGAERNARTSQGLKHAQERVESLRALTLELTRGADAAELSNHILEAATAVLPNSAGAVWLRTRDDDAPCCAGTFGLSTDYAGHASQLFPYLTPDRWVDIARQPLFVNAMSDAPRIFTDIARSEGFAASLTVALLTPARVLGALVLYTREQTLPADRDVEMLETLAASASLAVDRIQVEQQMQTLHRLIEHMPDGVFIHDIDGNFLMANPAMASLTAHPQSALDALNVFDLLEGGRAGKIGQALEARLRETIEGAASAAPQLVNIVRADQRVLQAEIFLQPLEMEAGQGETLIQGVLHDVTSRERIRREFDALRATAAAMATAGDLEQAINAVVHTLRDQAGYSRAAIWMTHQNEVELVRRAGDGETPATIPLGEGPVGRAAASGQPVVLRGTHGQLSVVGQQAGSQVCVPFSSNKHVTGVIDATGHPGRPIDEQDVAFLSSLAAHVASSIERIRLHKELQRQATIDTVTGLENRATFLKRMSDAIAMSRNNNPVSLLIVGVDRFKAVNDTYGHLIADDMLRQVAETLNVRVRPPYSIARYTSDQFAVLLPEVDRMTAPAVAENLRIGVATQLFMAAEQVEQITVSIGAATYPNDADSMDQLLLAASHAMYLAKQAGRNQVYQSNEAFAELAAAHGRITDLLRQAPRETLGLLVRAMDQRTAERAGHSQRVADYALALGRALGLPGDELSALRIAAVIHDIGMFSLPDSLLRKPAGLSDAERELLYSIPINAHRLLSPVDLPASVLPAVVHQHEHWDGSGFPSGMQGNMIPRGARIIAVADAIDAMTSDRAHRQSLSMDEALNALDEQAGTRFDPDVVRVARSLLGELQDVSSDRIGSDLESTLTEALAVIPPPEHATA